MQGNHESEWQKQRTGIREGCPLSPFLFILTMHVMFHDVKEQFNDPRQYKTFQHINFQELLYYADDTLIIATSAGAANAYLHLIEQESEYLHLRLNHDKCNYISFNASVRRIKFWNGTMMKPTTEAKYLGAVINENIDPAHEIR